MWIWTWVSTHQCEYPWLWTWVSIHECEKRVWTWVSTPSVSRSEYECEWGPMSANRHEYEPKWVQRLKKLWWEWVVPQSADLRIEHTCMLEPLFLSACSNDRSTNSTLEWLKAVKLWHASLELMFIWNLYAPRDFALETKVAHHWKLLSRLYRMYWLLTMWKHLNSLDYFRCARLFQISKFFG